MRSHTIGVRVVVWTVDQSTMMHHLFDLGVDGIITDRPDVLREVLIARRRWTATAKTSGIPRSGTASGTPDR